MGPRGLAGLTNPAQQAVGFHPHTRLHIHRREVAIEALAPGAVVQHHGDAIAGNRIHQQHPPGPGRAHRIPLRGHQIHPRMHAPAPALLGIAPLKGAHLPGRLIQGEIQRGLGSASILGGKPEQARGRQR